ncbi:hypothetical protein DNI29_06770 [Hymenobacter sediminis]|uniref:hypothetical protein n=1 Tax=Hymenobacter sediminis TaxID=2218621 RepID=UPI000DA6408C|nr:hypothetical protein [Hymenobacter sediminis]RPD48326.1 hypothetical protein DNI29_06770 [Hymenobacter sediminis]
MPGTLPFPTEESAATAVLLVMLPAVARQAEPIPVFSIADQARLQRQLGPAVQVLRINATDYEAVVRSFEPVQLPACVLVRQGLELWRTEGLPRPDNLAPLILSKVQVGVASGSQSFRTTALPGD